MTEEVLKRWMFNIYLELKELSDIEYQKKIWFGKITGLMSSFIELYCSLFDDHSIEEFVDDEMPKLGASDIFIKEISKMVSIMKRYDDKNKTHAQILDDPEWHRISDQAKIVLSYWKKEFGIPEQPELSP